MSNCIAPKPLDSRLLQDKVKKEAKPYRLGETSFLPKTSALESNSTTTCHTSVFYMSLPVGSGEKIMLQKVQTLSDGNFLVAGTITLSDNSQEGVIIKMTNGGTILSQTRIRINDKSTFLYSMKVMLDGNIAIAGSIQNGANSIFIAKLQSDLTISWTQMIALRTSPVKVTLDLLGTDQIALGIQLPSSVYYSTFTLSGAFNWGDELPVSGLENLVGFCNFNYQSFGLVINCIQSGISVSKIIEVNNKDGSLRASSIVGTGTDENVYMDLTYFNQTLDLVGLTHSDGGYKLVRTLNQTSDKALARHTYTLTDKVDFNITAAMDNAGDAMCFCLPQEGKMVFIKQFSDYLTVPEFTNEYKVPMGTSITAVTRSLQDGGFLFALNTADNKEGILIKTDSIGSLPDCGFTTVPNAFHEDINSPNTIISDVSNATSFPISNPTVSIAPKILVPQFSCNETYCPPKPAEDSCLSSYYKILRSNSYSELFSGYYLMRNNRQIAMTERYDRVLGDGNQAMEGLSLFDETGHFLKGVNLFLNGASTGISALQMDDTSLMLIGYSSPPDQIPEFTFTLVSDDLNVVWTKTIKTYANYEFFPSGLGYDDLVKDKDGNFYFVTNSTKFFDNKSKILVYKMDKSGNQVWLKAYEMNKGTFNLASATTTETSLIIVLEGGGGDPAGSGSVRIDKNTGEMLNSFLFQTYFDGGLYRRPLKFSGDRIYYAGSTLQDQVMMGTFDTLGRPLKLRYINGSNSIPRAANVKNGNLYITFDHYDGFGYKDVLLKADSTLNLVFINQYNVGGYRLAKGLDVSDNGSIYVGGWDAYGSYFDSYLEKYNSDGQLGTCGYNPLSLDLVDIDPQTITNDFSPLQRTFQPVDVPLTLVPDLYGQAIGSVLCSSAPQCHSIKISGTNAVCRLNEDYAFYGTKNANCSLQPVWLYDTAYAALHIATADTAQFRFKKTGNTYVVARINAGCKYYDDSLQVKIQSAPLAFTLGKDTLLCPSDSLTLKAGSGFNFYQWQDGSTDSEFTVRKAGAYYVKVGNVCNDVFQDTILISSAFLPALNIGNDTTVCKGDTIQLSASSGFAKYNWQPRSSITTQSQQTALITQQNTTVSLTATTSDGCKAKDSVKLTVTAPRPINLGRDTSFCSYDSVLLSAGTGYAQYIWNNGSTTSSITAKQTGMYWVHAKDVNGCFAKDTLVVQTLFARPVVNLGSDQGLCSGTVEQLDAGTYVSYQWQDGTDKEYYLVSQPGKYWVNVTDKNNCAGSDTINVQKLLPLPSGFLKGIDSICEYEKITIQPSGSFMSYQWSTGSIEPIITVSKAGLYSLQVKNSNGCMGNDTIQIVQKQCMNGVFIPSAFTPNHDGVNDEFRAMVYGTVIAFQLQIFDRFGKLVFATTDPYKAWDGTVKGLPYDTGTFAYQCLYQLAGGKQTFDKGTVVLIR